MNRRMVPVSLSYTDALTYATNSRLNPECVFTKVTNNRLLGYNKLYGGYLGITRLRDRKHGKSYSWVLILNVCDVGTHVAKSVNMAWCITPEQAVDVYSSVSGSVKPFASKILTELYHTWAVAKRQEGV